VNTLLAARRAERTVHDRGAASTELALLFGLIIVLTLFPFQVALLWHAQQSASLAAEAALDVGQLEAGTEAEAETLGRTILDQTNQLVNSNVEVTRNVGARTVTAVAYGDLRFQIIPLGWSVRSEAFGRIEEFVGVDDR